MNLIYKTERLVDLENKLMVVGGGRELKNASEKVLTCTYVYLYKNDYLCIYTFNLYNI